MERLMPYVHDSCWRGREFVSLQHMHEQAALRCKGVARPSHLPNSWRRRAGRRLRRSRGGESNPLPGAGGHVHGLVTGPSARTSTSGSARPVFVGVRHISRWVDDRATPTVVQTFDHEQVIAHPRPPTGRKSTGVPRRRVDSPSQLFTNVVALPNPGVRLAGDDADTSANHRPDVHDERGGNRTPPADPPRAWVRTAPTTRKHRDRHRHRAVRGRAHVEAVRDARRPRRSPRPCPPQRTWSPGLPASPLPRRDRRREQTTLAAGRAPTTSTPEPSSRTSTSTPASSSPRDPRPRRTARSLHAGESVIVYGPVGVGHTARRRCGT